MTSSSRSSARQQYRESHIPGALFAHLERDLSAAQDRQERPPSASRARTLLRLARPAGPASAPTRSSATTRTTASMAARLWWMLRWVGHEAVAVLDGGFAKWLGGKAAGERRHSLVSVHRLSGWKQKPRGLVDGAIEVHGKRHCCSMRARRRATAASRSRSTPWPATFPARRTASTATTCSPQGTFKSADELRREFASILEERSPSEVVHYCGSGVSACHNLLAMEIAGLPGGRLYAGSWSEWIADPSRPVATSAAKPLGR